MILLPRRKKKTQKWWCELPLWPITFSTFSTTKMHRQEDAYVPALVDILRWFASEANNKMARAALRRELSVARHFACITRTAAHLLIISWLQFVLSSSKQKKMRHCESSIHPCGETSCEVAAVAHCWQAIFNYEYDFSDNNELSTINHSVICLRAGGDEDEDKEWWTEKCHKVLPLTFEKKTASLLLPTSTWAPFWKKHSNIQAVIDMDTLM